MKVLLFLIAGFLVFFVVLSKKYDNPYKLFFIFGKKGAGKSLYMVKLMLRYIKKGWTVYTDISNVKIPGIRIMKAMDLSTFAPEPKSVIFLDEAGILFDNRNFKNFDFGLRDFFKLQRKYKCRVYLNSQSFDIDKKIRDVTDHMGLMISIGNVFSVYRPIRRSITLTAHLLRLNLVLRINFLLNLFSGGRLHICQNILSTLILLRRQSVRLCLLMRSKRIYRI